MQYTLLYCTRPRGTLKTTVHYELIVNWLSVTTTAPPSTTTMSPPHKQPGQQHDPHHPVHCNHWQDKMEQEKTRHDTTTGCYWTTGYQPSTAQPTTTPKHSHPRPDHQAWAQLWALTLNRTIKCRAFRPWHSFILVIEGI